MSEVETDVAPGLPEHLPPGETVLWQGAPDWRSLAVRAFHVRKMAVYCGVLLVWRLGIEITSGHSLATTALGLAYMLPLLVAGIGLPLLLAWLYARATIYTITSRRVVMRIGVALPLTLNLPFTIIGTAGLRRFADGTGDLPLALRGTGKVSYLHLWPHARPWRVGRPEPMLRCVPDAARVAGLLAEAMAAAVPGVIQPVAALQRPGMAQGNAPAMAPTAAAA